MKTANIPSLRVTPELRKAAESVLTEGESLSSFVEKSIKASIAHRLMREEFISRGLASRDEAKRTDEYFAADDVLLELDNMLKVSESRHVDTED